MDPLMLQLTWTVTAMVIELPGMFGDGCYLFVHGPLQHGRTPQARRASFV